MSKLAQDHYYLSGGRLELEDLVVVEVRIGRQRDLVSLVVLLIQVHLVLALHLLLKSQEKIG